MPVGWLGAAGIHACKEVNRAAIGLGTEEEDFGIAIIFVDTPVARLL